MSKLTDLWVMRPFPRPNATKRLFCFPFAGGGASAYRQWANASGPTLEVCPIQLPGRENRLLEPAYDDSESLTVALLLALSPLLDKPYAFYGHSMGALLAFELARSLEDSCGTTGGPERVFLAAHRAAHLPLQRSPMADLPQEALIAKLSEYGGFSDDVLNSQELMELILPAIRADLKLCDLYHFKQKNLLRCPINVVVGALDKQTSIESTHPWAIHTSGQTEVHVINGGHFFLHTHSAQVLEVIRTNLFD
jgi:medium-chain acyl-[acyl-carrier-protein] hydrolase